MSGTPPRAGRCLGAAAILTAAGLLGGCQSNAGLRAANGDLAIGSRASLEQVDALVRQAASEMATDPAGAAAQLDEALASDPFHGPALNNRGVLHLAAGDLYAAAQAFEAAGRAMPGNPEPRVNLGLTFERAGRVDDALRSYRTALEVDSEHLPAMQALARGQLQWGRADDRTAGLLDAIASRSSDSVWIEWARMQRTRRIRVDG